jgi:hypothetical protein
VVGVDLAFSIRLKFATIIPDISERFCKVQPFAKCNDFNEFEFTVQKFSKTIFLEITLLKLLSSGAIF